MHLPSLVLAFLPSFLPSAFLQADIHRLKLPFPLLLSIQVLHTYI
jgi:hypothetical protein